MVFRNHTKAIFLCISFSAYHCIYIIIIIIIIIILNKCLQTGALSLSLSLSFSLSLNPSLLFIASGTFSRLHLVSTKSWYKYVFVVQPILAFPCTGVHESTLLTNSSLLLLSSGVFFVLLEWFVRLEASGRKLLFGELLFRLQDSVSR